MAIKNQIDRITKNISNTYDVLESKGATIPEIKNSENLAIAAQSLGAKLIPEYTQITLLESNWQMESEGIYKQTVDGFQVKDAYKIDLALDNQTTLQLVNDSVISIRVDNDNNVAVAVCIGAKPSVDIQVQLSLDLIKGDPGKTPVKGVDYYTEQDKQEMVQAVIAALPVYNGEVE